jgi:hypothetical protein
MQITGEVSEWRRKYDECEGMYREGMVFSYRNLVQPCQVGRKESLAAAMRVLDQRIAANRSSLTKAQADQALEVSRAFRLVSELESKASEKADSYVGKGGCAGVILIAFGVFIASMNVAVSTTPEQTNLGWAGVVVMLIIFAAFSLKNPILKYFTATLPANEIRSQMPEQRRQAERVKAESDARFAKETARLNEELDQLSHQKEECQRTLTA